MEEENFFWKNVFSPFVSFLPFLFLLDNMYGPLIAHFPSNSF